MRARWGMVAASLFFAAGVGAQPALVAPGGVKPGGGPPKLEAAPAAPRPGDAKPAAGARKPPIVCDGAQSLVLDDVQITNDQGPALKASGNCSVVVRKCVLVGADVGVHASGNASVVLESCKVTGKKHAVQASGNASVALTGVELTGDVHTSGNANVSGQ